MLKIILYVLLVFAIMYAAGLLYEHVNAWTGIALPVVASIVYLSINDYKLRKKS